MPHRYLYAHSTCAVCGYAGGLVIASPSDPRCWPCEDWADKFPDVAVPIGVRRRVQHVERPVEFFDLSAVPEAIPETPVRHPYEPRVRPFTDVMTITIEKQALAFRTVCEELLADVPLRYLDEPES